jgi:Patatin-like phospholipase
MKMNSDKKTFYVGICMAGAISAGAYTAGVMDFLIEALELWEQAKREKRSNVPTHRVQIPVIGGASAGGMTGIITAAGINGDIPPVQIPQPGNLFQERPDNIFYHSWVDLTRADIFPAMLEPDDIAPNTVHSLLNSDFIDILAKRATQPNQGKWVHRPYIDDHLKIFATLTNIQGFTYALSFKRIRPEKLDYFVQSHNDYACFVLNRSERQYKKDGWIPLDFRNNVNTDLAAVAAMATGAFPIGLRARHVDRDAIYVNQAEWLREITEHFPVKEQPYKALVVDGGLINNEPFEKVQDVLAQFTGQKEVDTQDFNKFQSTVLMIEPFPTYERKFGSGDLLLNVFGNTIGAMLGQLRTKPSILIEALSSNNAGQFLIAPVRSVPHTSGGEKLEYGEKAIACGSLGGFGGFLNKEFRIHDFFLGRANCEKFLRDYFTFRAGTKNPIFKAGYSEVRNTQPYRSRIDKSLQIIPLMKSEGEYPLPIFSSGKNWPVRLDDDISRFKPMIKNRLDPLLRNLHNFGFPIDAVIWGATKTMKGFVADRIISAIESSLRGHQLLS